MGGGEGKDRGARRESGDVCKILLERGKEGGRCRKACVLDFGCHSHHDKQAGRTSVSKSIPLLGLFTGTVDSRQCPLNVQCIDQPVGSFTSQ